LTGQTLIILLNNGESSVNGILNIDKPPGKTSYNIVSLVKRLSGEKRVGHAGTLDPLASGVLPVLCGQATRVAEFLADYHKVYHAQIELGLTTNTYDAEGTITAQKDPSYIGREQIASALNQFRGRIQQVPPMYSALKHHGRPLYLLARCGIQVERASRTVTVHRLELLDWQPPVLNLEVECSKGTYIRSLAHDLGQALGCGAILKELVRTRYGPFDIAEAASLTKLKEAFLMGNWHSLVYPMDTVLRHFPAVVVDDAATLAIKNGNHVILDTSGNSTDISSTETSINVPAEGIKLCRAYTKDSCLLAILRYEPEQGWWQPEKVFKS
jgi:tRNA pseudouridine55 synthase